MQMWLYDRVPRIVLSAHAFRAKRKAGLPRIRLKQVVIKDLKEIGTSLDGV